MHTRSRSPRPYIFASIALILLAFAIRVHDLGGDSLWLDEILTANAIGGGAGAMLEQVDHPPLLYALGWLSVDRFGESEWSLRLPSLYAATLAFPLLIALGRALRRPELGLWTGLLLAVAPLHLRYTHEARHYALLSTVTLATFVLLVRAMRRPTVRRWLAFAIVTVANLYVHYGAMIVLLAQMFLIAGWLATRGRASWRTVRYPLLAAVAVAILYLPWLPSVYQAVTQNIGSDAAIRNVASPQSLSTWLDVAYTSFGMFDRNLAAVLLALVFVGLLLWLWQRRWWGLALFVTGVGLPLLLTTVVPVARAAFPRYILYALPFYLLAAGNTFAAGLRPLAVARPRLFAVVALLLIGSIVIAGYKPIEREYAFMQRDWRGVVDYLDEHAANGDVLLLMTLSFPTGDNLVNNSMSYYLAQDDRELEVVTANALKPNDVAALAAEHGQVWALFSNWATPTEFSDETISVTPFQTSVFLVRDTAPADNALAELIHLYQQIIPLATSPSPQCLLSQDLAVLQIAAGDLDSAESTLETNETRCAHVPVAGIGNRQREVAQTLEVARLDALVEAGDDEQARAVAREVLIFNAKEPLAISTLTAVDLLAQFSANEATVSDALAPEKARVERFTMPQNGDWGDVLFLHPPASVSFDINLPQEPVYFYSRVALAPQSWDWGGDGVTFALNVTTADGETVELWRMHVANEEAAHKWHEIQVSLLQLAGQEITLTLATEAGPAGDGTGDWAGWETPRLMWEAS